ncbi:KOW domain-containing protein [Astrocystis sublimbata]|nr:KOW domain-containing protein [Astrocystis sublimbata]
MQKIARRVATAERVVAKRKKGKDFKLYRHERHQDKKEMVDLRKTVKTEIESAKQAIKNDWAMGALSPRRDVGERHDTIGSISRQRVSQSKQLTLAQLNARCRWAGGATYLNLAVHDRVVLLDGPDKGRIGNILEINHESAEVTVKDLNKSNIFVEPFMRGPGDPTSINFALPLPISAVRLVHPIYDPAADSTRDVIINQLVHRGLVTDRQTGKRRWDRVVPGLNVSIPWPEKKPSETPDYKADTMRIDVEEKTFVPTLLRPPMPEAVIDELRNKYSRFRTRHEPEYIARIEAAEQEKKDRVNLMESMRTPLQEFHRAERKSKKKRGYAVLTGEMLEKIGEVIARNRERSLNAAGVSAVATTGSSVDVSPPASSDTTPPPTSESPVDVPPPASSDTSPPPSS